MRRSSPSRLPDGCLFPAIRSRLAVALTLLTVCIPADEIFAQAAAQPLHQQVNELLPATTTGPLANSCSDSEFLRRVSLDLIGTIPTAEELRAFLADTAADKRARVVDALLADPRSSLHLAEVFDTLLMERRPARHVPFDDWLNYLQASFRANKPWNQLAKELVTSDGTDPATRPAARFFLDREAEPHVMTRDIGRIFFGVDLQCAQCHDHPLVDHYAQSDYYGLFAFVNRTVLHNDEAAKQMQLGEKADGQADFRSVFTDDASRSRPRLPGGPELDEPHFALGDEYTVAPADKVRPVSKHSRRALLGLATDGSNAAFNRNLPNRLWAHLFGRGLVHPVDWHHPHNPPTHPQVLNAITDSFVASGYDIRELLRQLVLTDAYQRSIDAPASLTTRLAEAKAEVERLTTRVTALEAATLEASKQQGTLYTQMLEAGNALNAPNQEYDKSVQAALALRKPLIDAEAALNATQTGITTKQAQVTALTDAAKQATAASGLLKEDMELAQAAATIEKRRASTTEELAALQKTAETQTAAVEAARSKWNEGVAASETVYAANVKLAETWEQKKRDWLIARSATLASAAELQATKRLQERWQKSAQLVDQQAAETGLVAQVASQDALRVAAAQAVNDQTAVVATATQTLVTAKTGTEAAFQTLTTAQSLLATQQGIIKPVSEAIASTEQALQKLPEDPALVEILARLKTRQEPLQAAVDSANTMVTTRTTEHQTAATAQQTADASLQAAQTELTKRQADLTRQMAALAKLQTDLQAARTQITTTTEELRGVWEQEFAIRIEKPVSPEQFTYAILTATGMMEVQRSVAEGEIEKTIPRESVKDDAAKIADRQYQVEKLLRQRLRGNVNAFVNQYAAGAGQPQDQFFASVDQALFVANGPTVQAWVAPSGNNLLVRLKAIEEPAAFANELYASTLNRMPSADEVAQVTQFLDGRKEDRMPAIQEVVWALISCAEFRFNF